MARMSETPGAQVQRLPRGEKGEREIEQITIALFAQFLLRKQERVAKIVQLGAGLWLG